jgi:hypothetical protein
MAWKLNFLSDEIALETAGTDLQSDGCPFHYGLYLLQIRFPGTAGMVFCVAHRIPGDRMLSTNIASP